MNKLDINKKRLDPEVSIKHNDCLASAWAVHNTEKPLNRYLCKE